MMFNGPGKYNDEATHARESTEAEGVALLVSGGSKGGGFCVQGSIQFIAMLPDLLEDMAQRIRQQMRDD